MRKVKKPTREFVTKPFDQYTREEFAGLSRAEQLAVLDRPDTKEVMARQREGFVARLARETEKREALTRAVRQCIADRGGRPIFAPALSYADRRLIAQGLDPLTQPSIQDWIDGKWDI